MSKTKSYLPIGEAGKPAGTFETRITWLFALFYSSEKGFHCLVNPSEGFLEHLAVNSSVFRSKFFDFWELVRLVVVGDGLLLQFVGFASFLKTCVVQLTAKRKSFYQCLLLLSGRVKPVFERFSRSCLVFFR